jgi:hypothetical protein
MNPLQQGRAEALKVAGSVLSASSGLFGTKSMPKEVSDLLEVASWIVGDVTLDMADIERITGAERELFPMRSAQVLEIRPEDLPSIFETLSKLWPDCDQPGCPIHGPTREAKDLDGGIPWEAHGSNPDRERDPRNESGGQADAEDDPEDGQ